MRGSASPHSEVAKIEKIFRLAHIALGCEPCDAETCRKARDNAERVTTVLDGDIVSIDTRSTTKGKFNEDQDSKSIRN